MKNVVCGLIGVVVGPAGSLAADALPLVSVEEVRTVIVLTDGGTGEVRECQPSNGDLTTSAQATATLPLGSTLLWHNNLTFAVYNNASITLPSASLAVGTFLNVPKEVQFIPLVGQGVPDWGFPGNDFQVAASRDADVIAATDFAVSSKTVTIRKWHVASGVPDWSFFISPALPALYHPVAVSADGGTIAVLITMQGNPINARLYYFDSSSATPLGIFNAPPGTNGWTVRTTDDGQYIAFSALTSVYVLERDTDSLRYSIDTGSQTTAMAISGDAHFLAYGATSLTLRQWDGEGYDLLWQHFDANNYLSRCEISSDGSTLVSSWYPPSLDRNRVDLFELPSPDRLWSYTYQLGSGGFQDMVVDLAITQDGSHVASASWGDQLNSNPEVHIFEHASPLPVITVDTPGSMFDVDIAKAPGGRVYGSACGKHVHANQSGFGGDLYAIAILSAGGGDLDDDGSVGIVDVLMLLAHWGPCLDWFPLHCSADLDGDNLVGITDLLNLLANW